MQRFWLLLCLCLFMFSGCSNTDGGDIVSNADVLSADISNVDVPDASSDTDSSSPEEAYSAFIDSSPSLSEISAYITQNIDSVPSQLADRMLQDWIVELDLSASERDSVFYGNDSELYFTTLYDAINLMDTPFVYTPFMGSQKEKTLGYVKNEDVSSYLSALFTEGYGLMSSEGLFYAYPDYILISDQYGHYGSDSLKQYLEVMVSEINEPLFAEETLNVSVDTLFQRTYYYETLFASTQDLKESLRMNLAGLLNMCYYRLLVPSSYDMLDDEHRVSESLKAFYQEGAVHTETPITAAICTEMLAFFDEKGDILNAFEDPSIYEHANQYFEDGLGNSLSVGD